MTAPAEKPSISPQVAAVICRALRDYESLPLHDRIELLVGVTQICPAGTEPHESAKHLSALLVRLENEQLIFRSLFPSK